MTNKFDQVDGTAIMFVNSSKFGALVMTLDNRDLQKQGKATYCSHLQISWCLQTYLPHLN